MLQIISERSVGREGVNVIKAAIYAIPPILAAKYPVRRALFAVKESGLLKIKQILINWINTNLNTDKISNDNNISKQILTKNLTYISDCKVKFLRKFCQNFYLIIFIFFGFFKMKSVDFTRFQPNFKCKVLLKLLRF